MTNILKKEYYEKVKGLEKLKEREECLDEPSRIFHQMGLATERKAQFYFKERRMPNYFLSKLQAVGLLNGSMSGKRGEKCKRVLIEKDLQSAIEDVLISGNAADKKVNLLNFSKIMSKVIHLFREKAKESLNEIPDLYLKSHRTSNEAIPDILLVKKTLTKQN